jgi:hypothetical protein
VVIRVSLWTGADFRSWQLAEFAGDGSPDGMQRLLNFSPWEEDAARDGCRRKRILKLRA